MQDLTTRLSLEQKSDIAREVELLFKAHDKPLDVDKKAMLVTSICAFGFPFGAIITSIRKLRDRPMDYIRLSDLKEAIRLCVTYDQGFDECAYCQISGFVYMRREDGYMYTLPCVCPRGKHLAEIQHLTGWNGFRTQIIKGHTLTLAWPDPADHKIPEMDAEMDRACAEVDGEVVGVGGGFSE